MNPIPAPEESDSTTHLEDDLQHTETRSETRLRAGHGSLTLRRLRMAILAVVRVHRS